MTEKTLRDYLCRGGVEGKYFVEQELGERTYRVVDVGSSECNYEVVLEFANGEREGRELRWCSYDVEATSKQIKKFREKESKLNNILSKLEIVGPSEEVTNKILSMGSSLKRRN